MVENLEQICFQIISNSGMAKSNFIEAIQKAKENEFEVANQLIEEADNYFVEAHKIHAGLIQKEAAGEKCEFSLLFMHAEDQMASAELAKVLAQEIIELYQRIDK